MNYRSSFAEKSLVFSLRFESTGISSKNALYNCYKSEIADSSFVRIRLLASVILIALTVAPAAHL